MKNIIKKLIESIVNEQGFGTIGDKFKIKLDNSTESNKIDSMSINNLIKLYKSKKDTQSATGRAELIKIKEEISNKITLFFNSSIEKRVSDISKRIEVGTIDPKNIKIETNFISHTLLDEIEILVTVRGTLVKGAATVAGDARIPEMPPGLGIVVLNALKGITGDMRRDARETLGSVDSEMRMSAIVKKMDGSEHLVQRADVFTQKNVDSILYKIVLEF